jgi:hypothetical protein
MKSRSVSRRKRKKFKPQLFQVVEDLEEMSEENKEALTGDQDASGSAAGGNNSANDTLDAVIGAYVATAKQLPGVIPELISGKNLNEVNASIDTAKAAFKRVADSVKPADGAAGGQQVQPAPVPAVGTGASAAASGEQPKLSSSAGFDKILAGVEGKGKQSR